MTRNVRLGMLPAVISVFFVIGLSAVSAVAQKSTPDTHPPIRTIGDAQPGIVGLTPLQVRHAYGFDHIADQGQGQVIGIVDAFDHPHIEDDLAVFNQAFLLPSCTTNSGCFQKIVAGNGKNPGTKTLWGLEISLDVEWVHAIAPLARIVLVEAQSANLSDMVQAVDLAVQNGASVVSMSWGAPEFSTETAFDNHFLATNVTFVAASGDFGNPGFYPAASPFVTGVGGTTLSVDAAGNWSGETAWNGSGGGISGFEATPSYQPHSFAGRGIPDVAYDADPNTGFAVYDSQGFGGWIQVGGTSAGAPQWAALIAIANSIRLQSNKSQLTGANSLLYRPVSSASSYAADYHDITSGSNGTCGTVCTAGTGYDFVTGLGSPKVEGVISTLTK